MAALTNKVPPLRNHIAMNEELEVKYWTKHLGVSQDELQRAVDKLGIPPPRFAKNWKHQGKTK
jgi:Protein of unknown function (DUF3606)